MSFLRVRAPGRAQTAVPAERSDGPPLPSSRRVVTVTPNPQASVCRRIRRPKPDTAFCSRGQLIGCHDLDRWPRTGSARCHVLPFVQHHLTEGHVIVDGLKPDRHRPDGNAGGRLHCPPGCLVEDTQCPGLRIDRVTRRQPGRFSQRENAEAGVLSSRVVRNSRSCTKSLQRADPEARAIRTPNTSDPVWYIHFSPGWCMSGKRPQAADPLIRRRGGPAGSAAPGRAAARPIAF